MEFCVNSMMLFLGRKLATDRHQSFIKNGIRVLDKIISAYFFCLILFFHILEVCYYY